MEALSESVGERVEIPFTSFASQGRWCLLTEHDGCQADECNGRLELPHYVYL